jgi:hypothetical protein
MRGVCLLSLLFIACSAFAGDDFVQVTPKTQWDAPLRASDGTFQFRTVPDAGRWAASPRDQVFSERQDENVCYFIRSYIMKRRGETGATYLDRVQTCTPKSTIRKKATVRVVPAIE